MFLTRTPEYLSDLFQYAYDIYRFSSRVKDSIPKTLSLQELVCATLFLRIFGSYWSCCSLAESGMYTDACVVSRSCCEAVVLLKACMKLQSLYEDYLKTDYQHRLKLLNVIKHSTSDTFNEIKDIATEELKESLQEIIQEEAISMPSIESLAKKKGVDLGIFYDIPYRYLSDEVHVSPRTLEKYLIINDKREIQGLTLEPDFKNVPQVMVTNITLMLLADRLVIEQFSLDYAEEVSSFDKKLFEITSQYKPKV